MTNEDAEGLVAELILLAEDMVRVAVSMKRFAGQFAEKGDELLGAAAIATQWVSEMENTIDAS